jgi:hypothetical protein
MRWSHRSWRLPNWRNRDHGRIFLFFLLSGMLWVLPAMGIIKWLILEPPRPKN